MTAFDKFAITSGVVALILAAIILIYRKLRSGGSEVNEKKRVSRLLKQFAGVRHFTVMDNPVLLSGGQSGWADHILVGHFGILLVYDLGYRGDYFGKVTDEKWVVGIPSKGRYQLNNPLIASAQCTGRVRVLLKEAGVTQKISIETLVVMTGTAKDTINYIKADEIVMVGKLRKYLGKAKFDQDKDVDVEAVTAVLNAAKKEA